MASGDDLHKVVFTTATASKDGRKMFMPIGDGIPAPDVHLASFNEIVFSDMKVSSQKSARGLEDKEWYIDPQTLKKVYRV